MVIRKSNPRLPTVNGNGTKAKNGIELLLKKGSEPVDHWDFLDEIEAPMWADLTVECKSTYADKDDEWFHTSHLFHQSSSQELKAAFSSIEEICADMDFGIQQQSSPNLPPSVSRSRGKDYRSREWGKGNCKIGLDKKHPIKNLNSKSSWVNSGLTKAMKDETSRTKLKHYGQSSFSQTSRPPCSQPVSSCGSLAAEGGENNSSTITSEDSEQQHQKSSVTSNSSSTTSYEDIEQPHQKSIEMSNSTGTATSELTELQPLKCTEISSQVPGRTSDFLSTLRVSFRKSCITRQALRVVVNSRRQSEGRKFASSKSSIGSSNPRKEDRNQSTSQTKDTTLDSRNVFRMSHPPKEKTKLPSMSKGHHTHTIQQKALIPNRGNRNVPSNEFRKAKESMGTKSIRTMASGKENAPGVIAVSQKSSFRERGTTVRVQVPKVLKETGTSARTTLTGLKVRLDNRREVKNTRKIAEKVFLR